MKGYIPTINMKPIERCLTYEIGKTYKISRGKKIKYYSFIIFSTIKIALDEYSPRYPYSKKDFVLLEVETDTENYKNEPFFETNTFKVIRVVPKEEYSEYILIEEYDDKGNPTELMFSNGYHYKNEYDNRGNLIRFKTCDNPVHLLRHDEEHYTITYDDKGNKTGFFKWEPTKYKRLYEYDDKGNMIHFKEISHEDPYIYEYWCEYDDKGDMIYHKDNDGYAYRRQYDDKGNVTHFKDNDGYEYTQKFDTKGNMVSYTRLDKDGQNWKLTIK